VKTKKKDIYRSLNLRKLNREPGQIILNDAQGNPKTHEFVTPTEADMMGMLAAAALMSDPALKTEEQKQEQLLFCKQMLMDKVLAIIPSLYGEEVTFDQLMAILDLFVEMRASLNE
jgi:hypothetical protein